LNLIRDRQPDLILMEDRLAVMQGEKVARIVQEEALAPIVLTVGRDWLNLRGEHRILQDFAYIFKPVSEDSLFPVIDLAMRDYRKIRELEDEINKLKQTLQTRKLVEKAKGILMRSQGLSEEEAFKRMQRQSMNKRLSMKSVAKAIILAHELDFDSP
jgi:AmiR/NasT family two-component response regulator